MQPSYRAVFQLLPPCVVCGRGMLLSLYSPRRASSMGGEAFWGHDMAANTAQFQAGAVQTCIQSGPSSNYIMRYLF